MRKISLILLAFVMFSCQHSEMKKQNNEPVVQNLETNDFYDDAPGKHLVGDFQVTVSGEVAETYNLDLSDFPRRSVIFKNTKYSSDGGKFIGAYEYHGVSLYDILNHVKLQKANQENFAPIIDLYVVVENAKGDFSVFSWGEIYYAANRHQIIIADRVNPIVPSKTKDQWPMPEIVQLVPGLDLFTDRMISNPTQIGIYSFHGEFAAMPKSDKMYADTIALKNVGKDKRIISELPATLPDVMMKSTFYGRGRGIHGITDFKGKLLKDVIVKDYPMSPKALRQGLVVVSAADAYRAVFTYSEIMNRNDQSEILITDRGDVDGGRFRIFPAPDYFSDRAVKSVSTIDYYSMTRDK